MALIKCKNCGHVISDKALCCPHCGYKLKTSADNKQRVRRNLVIVVIILSIIAIALGGYLIGVGKYQRTNSAPLDSTAIDSIPAVETTMENSTSENSTSYVPNAVDTAISSNDYNSNEQIEEEEIGFKSNADVIDFVVGNSYSHEGITLRITDEAVYANDNKISTSKPVFRKISLNKGIITARPSISITVVRDDNRLVDNSNGDSYDYN